MSGHALRLFLGRRFVGVAARGHASLARSSRAAAGAGAELARPPALGPATRCSDGRAVAGAVHLSGVRPSPVRSHAAWCGWRRSRSDKLGHACAERDGPDAGPGLWFVGWRRAGRRGRGCGAGCAGRRCDGGRRQRAGGGCGTQLCRRSARASGDRPRAGDRARRGRGSRVGDGDLRSLGGVPGGRAGRGDELLQRGVDGVDPHAHRAVGGSWGDLDLCRGRQRGDGADGAVDRRQRVPGWDLHWQPHQ